MTRDLTGQIDGTRTDFVTPEAFQPGTLCVHLNGLRELPGLYFVEVDDQALRTFEPPLVGDTLQVQYEAAPEFQVVLASGVPPGAG